MKGETSQPMQEPADHQAFLKHSYIWSCIFQVLSLEMPSLCTQIVCHDFVKGKMEKEKEINENIKN